MTQRVRGRDGRWCEVDMPRCVRCGHEICPCCAHAKLVWCDHLVGDDFEECCDGECVVDVELGEVWRLAATVR